MPQPGTSFMKAWVISISSLEAWKSDTVGEVVIALISGRRTERFVKSYIENLASILCRSLGAQKAEAAYNNSTSRPYVHDDNGCCLYFYEAPYTIQGQKSEIMAIADVNGVSWLKWKGVKYSRFIPDHKIGRVDVDPPLKECPQAKFGLNTRAMFSKNSYPGVA
jgi:hypothetical protein